MQEGKEKRYSIELSKSEIEWVLNRKAILDHIYANRESKWMPYIYPDEVYRTSESYAESVWEELKRQLEIR